MALINERREFDSWLLALQADMLTDMQIAILQQLIDDGKAGSLEEAARLLDWQDTVIDPTEHFYGH